MLATNIFTYPCLYVLGNGLTRIHSYSSQELFYFSLNLRLCCQFHPVNSDMIVEYIAVVLHWGHLTTSFHQPHLQVSLFIRFIIVCVCVCVCVRVRVCEKYLIHAIINTNLKY